MSSKQPRWNFSIGAVLFTGQNKQVQLLFWFFVTYPITNNWHWICYHTVKAMLPGGRLPDFCCLKHYIYFDIECSVQKKIAG